MTKNDAIYLLSQLDEQQIEMIINQASFFCKPANWCLGYLEHCEYIFMEDNTIEILPTKETDRFQFALALNSLENCKQAENIPTYSAEEMEEMEAYHFYTQLAQTNYKPLHHKK